MAPPTRYPSGTQEAIQKYMLLSSQEEVLRRRVSLHIPCGAPRTAASPEFRSLSSSPISSRTSFSTTGSPEPEYAYSLMYPTSTSPIPVQSSNGHRHSIADPGDAHKLIEINKEIKATLTELLNTDSVRADEKYRQWVQSRLMDAEQQIRRQRRRRSSGSLEDREFASSIAEHLEYGLGHYKSWA